MSKAAYVALAILLGWIGAHEFYAGRTARGVLSVVFCWTLVPWVVARSPGGQDGPRRGGARRLDCRLEEAESPMRKERP